MEYPHPDGEGGFSFETAYEPCPACVTDGLCPACGQGMMEWGALLICVHCGFQYDEAAVPRAAETKSVPDTAADWVPEQGRADVGHERR